jgi:hypothetical protein
MYKNINNSPKETIDHALRHLCARHMDKLEFTINKNIIFLIPQIFQISGRTSDNLYITYRQLIVPRMVNC